MLLYLCIRLDYSDTYLQFSVIKYYLLTESITYFLDHPRNTSSTKATSTKDFSI